MKPCPPPVNKIYNSPAGHSMSALTQEDSQWLIAWLLRQSKQHQTLSKRAKRSRNFAEASRLSDLSVRLWMCATALTSQSEGEKLEISAIVNKNHQKLPGISKSLIV
jgi:hypothetical protein